MSLRLRTVCMRVPHDSPGKARAIVEDVQRHCRWMRNLSVLKCQGFPEEIDLIAQECYHEEDSNGQGRKHLNRVPWVVHSAPYQSNESENAPRGDESVATEKLVFNCRYSGVRLTTYSQSTRDSFVKIVPGGVCTRRNIATIAKANPVNGRLMSGAR